MNRLMQFFSFTKNETKVLLFIISILLVSLCIKYYKQIYTREYGDYDYSRNDSVFNSLSRKIYSGDHSGTNVRTEQGSDKVIDINTATKNELIGLPGVGDATADRIISYREQKKGFKKIEDLMNVSGIGKKKFEKMKPFIKTD